MEIQKTGQKSLELTFSQVCREKIAEQAYRRGGKRERFSKFCFPKLETKKSTLSKYVS